MAQVEIFFVGLKGDGFTLSVSEEICGRELQRLVRSQVGVKPGAFLSILNEKSLISLRKKLSEQEIYNSSSLSYVYVPANAWLDMFLQKVSTAVLFGGRLMKHGRELFQIAKISWMFGDLRSLFLLIFCLRYSAWKFLVGFPNEEEEFALEAMTLVDGIANGELLQYLPKTLQSLTFGYDFNESLLGRKLPERLLKLTFTGIYNCSLEGLDWPKGLRDLTLGKRFNQSLELVDFPESLRSLTFGDEFNRSMHAVSLPSSLQSLHFGNNFDQTLEGVELLGPQTHFFLFGFPTQHDRKGNHERLRWPFFWLRPIS